MSQIVFRGKTYKSVFEMPDDIRIAYQTEKRNNAGASNASKSLTDYVEMSDEMRKLHERAAGNVDDKPLSSKPLSNLPSTEDIFRQSAPQHMKKLPSDESIYRPSRSLNPPEHMAIEDDNGPRRLALTLAILLLLAGIAFFVMQYNG